jgi:predicted DNA-binding WGR domain protein
MSALTLHRADPARSMRRLYLLDMQPDLFRDWCLVREWGRIEQRLQVRVVPGPTEGPVQAAIARRRRVKQRMGYGSLHPVEVR